MGTDWRWGWGLDAEFRRGAGPTAAYSWAGLGALLEGGWGMCAWFSFDISALCVAEVVAQVTAWRLFLGIEGTPEHLSPLSSQDFWGQVPLGDASGVVWGPPSIWVSCFVFS